MTGETEIGQRKGLSKRLRFEVFKRDGFTCMYCGAHPPDALLECDHIDPVAAGGANNMDNLVTACFACNRGKSDVPLSSVPESLSERAARGLEQEAQIAGYEAVMKERRMRLEADAEQILDYFCDAHGRDGVPKADFTSMKRFVGKLGLDATLEAAEIGCNRFRFSYRKAFLYFCGVCWRKIRGPEGSDVQD
jgi:hypothetical protein